jgi:phage terminase large subunit-like protein
VVRSRIFLPGANGVIDQAALKAHLLDLADRYRVAEVAYDPRLVEMLAQELADHGLPMTPFKQSPERMVPACGFAYEQIAAGVVAHDGDPELADHVLSAAQRTSESGWTLSKGKSRRLIDACVAMVMALYELAQPAPPAEAQPLVMMVGGGSE